MIQFKPLFYFILTHTHTHSLLTCHFFLCLRVSTTNVAFSLCFVPNYFLEHMFICFFSPNMFFAPSRVWTKDWVSGGGHGVGETGAMGGGLEEGKMGRSLHGMADWLFFGM